MKSMSEPLIGDEVYLNRRLDADQVALEMTGAQIRLYALTDLIELAASNGFEITRGPEILAFHRPEFPGDQTWVRTVAVARPRHD